ncbi:hypothetical protein F0562_027142 [Nyssa sinensis]|uniref:Filament-like plant protein 4 n=1 Tax=Nyssa sinensis TaxID=561372 RepID=A0A5J5B4S9_9ASTE|nr:hypothetical protein F0562_027142 [Nyssa sinensis]
MRQIRNLKEEHEQKLHEVVLTKTKQWDKIKLELEAKIANLDQELLRSEAENAAFSRSLQERSNTLIKISEEKSQAEAEIVLLKSNVESCEKEINSLKYEFHIVTKELEIRNEEKNMSVKSADVANKQHLEGVKKITKLEAECQRLRGLVRKKLPGPAALAQMKQEVDNLGRDYGETRLRRSSVNPPSPSQHLFPLPEFSLDSLQKCQKENEFLTERLLATEEETKMLKEALAKRNSELQASRNICAKTISKLRSLEAQLQVHNQQKSSPKSNVQIPIEGSFSQIASIPPSLTSMSDDGNVDNGSCSGSWATALISDLSHFKKEKNVEKSNKAESTNHLELMNDFLEMEKLANLSNDSNGDSSSTDVTNKMKSEIVNHDALMEVTTATDFQSSEQPVSEPLVNQAAANAELSAMHPQSDIGPVPLMKLQSKISMVFESMSKDANIDKILENIKFVVQETHDNLHQHSVSCLGSQCSDVTCDREACPEETEVIAEKEISLSQHSKPGAETVHTISQELAAAISQIHDFVLVLGKEAMVVRGTSSDEDGLSQKLEEFSASFEKVINCKISVVDFVLDLSQVLSKASELQFNVLGYKNNETEIISADCIDKVALPENKVVQDSSGERYPNGCTHFSDSTSDPDIPHEGNFVPTSELNAISWKFSTEEFEQLKLEKDNMASDIARCTENLESTKSQLLETELLLAEVKSQLASAQKLNSLAETQLKCMAESYKSLEKRAEELQSEVNLLHMRTESLDNELQEERSHHQDALARCKDLQEQLQRIESCPVADIEVKTNQEREITAAAEKLAECQETIFLLGKQLKALRPQTELMGSPYSERSQKGQGYTEEEPTTSGMNLQDFDKAEMDSATSTNLQRAGSESPMDLYNSFFSPSDTESNNLQRSPISSKHAKHRPTKSSFSSSSAATPEKQSRGFSRFFSSKGKNVH